MFRRPDSNRSRSGFTLIELLVVIGIIGLLIGILLPALNSARGTAKTVKCLENCRGLGQMTLIYTTDAKGYVPLRPSGAVGGNGVWGAFWSSRALLRYESRDLRTFADPADEDASRLYPLGGGTGTGVVANSALGLGDSYGSGVDDTKGFRISYGINSNLTIQVYDAYAAAAAGHPEYQNDSVTANRIDQYNYPSQTLVYGDSSWINNRGFQNTTSDQVGSVPGWWLRYRLVFANYPGRLVWAAGSSGPFHADPSVSQTVDGVSTPIAYASPSLSATSPTGSSNGDIPTFDGGIAQYARHSNGNANITFMDGSGRGVSQADSVDTDPITATNTVVRSKVIYTIAEQPK